MLTAITSATCALAALLHAPPVFTEQSLEEAKAAAAESGRLLLIDATADWCPPCKEMDRTTWVDDRVVEWIDQRAIAVQLDVDEHPVAAHELGIRAMPTVIVFKDGKEFDRVVGYKSGEELVDWLEDVRQGRTSLDALRERVKDPAGERDVEARLDLARNLMQAGRHEEAAEAYQWLWQNMLQHEPAYAGVRLSFMASDMKDLADAHAPARKRFEKLRDSTEGRLKQEPRTWDDLSDWVVLNDIIDENEATLEWVDRIKTTDSGKDTLRRMSYLIDDLLLDSERWADYGLILANPVAMLRQEHAQIEMFERMQDDLSDEQRAQLRGFATRSFIETAGNLHASLLAAGREEEAWDVASESLRLLDDPALSPTLVRTALRAGEARPRHLDMLGADDGQERLIEEVERALEAR